MDYVICIRDIPDEIFINHIFKYLIFRDCINVCILCTKLIHLLSEKNIKEIYRIIYNDVYEYLKPLNLKIHYKEILNDLDYIKFTLENDENDYTYSIQKPLLNSRYDKDARKKVNKIIEDIRQNKIWKVYYLIKSGYDVTCMKNKAFRIACIEDKTEIVKLFFSLPKKYGINPLINFEESICSACKNDNYEVAKLLLDYVRNRYIPKYRSSSHNPLYLSNKKIKAMLLEYPVEYGIN